MVSRSSTSAKVSFVSAAFALPQPSVAYPLPNEADVPHVADGRVDYRPSPMNGTANEVTILFSNDEMRRQLMDLQRSSMTALQNHRTIAEQVDALSMSVANLQRMSFARILDDDAIAPLAIESGLAMFARRPEAHGDPETLADLLAAAADTEYFPQTAIQLSRKHISSADNLLRMASARVLALAGDANDRGVVQDCINKEKNDHVKKVMLGALEAATQ
jgi:hypothetical protein